MVTCLLPATYNTKDTDALCAIAKAAPQLPAFAPVVVDFMQAFSNALLLEKEFRAFPELMALGFWFRKHNILQLQQAYQVSDLVRVPRGMAFHIAPANVDSIFIYSTFLSLLVGNTNIVRISSTPNAQLDVLLNILNLLIAKPAFSLLADRLMIVRYAHSSAVTGAFSAHCRVRVVWGGDATVATIRQVPLPANATELAFANKFSWAVLDANWYCACADTEKQKLAEGFYNDCYWFDQLACSSPRAVAWVGTPDKATEAQAVFWHLLGQHIVAKQYNLSASQAVDKLSASYSVAIDGPDMGVHLQPLGSDNYVTRVALDAVTMVPRGSHCGSGMFFEIVVPDLSAFGRCLSAEDQTVAYAGFSKSDMSTWVALAGLAGVDRVVPIGQALAFNVVWDGQALLNAFTRIVDVI